jgi:hypothetical protein
MIEATLTEDHTLAGEVKKVIRQLILEHNWPNFRGSCGSCSHNLVLAFSMLILNCGKKYHHGTVRRLLGNIF